MVSAKQVRTAIYQKLNVAAITASLANGSASIHHAVAPSDAAYPMLLFNLQAETPTHQFTGAHFDAQVWMVKAIAKGGSSSTAEDLAKAIADRLDFKGLAITGADDMYLAREGGINYVEVVSGDVYRHHGNLYRLIYQNT